ncbi:MAG: MBL fold metallo-hydrolase [Nitrospinaceae bacterium]
MDKRPPLPGGGRRVGMLALVLWLAGCVVPPGPLDPAGAQDTAAGSPATPAPEVYDGYTEPPAPLPAWGYFLRKIAPDVYFFSTGYYNTLFLVSTDGVILVDPLRGAGLSLRKAIEQVTPLPVKVIIYSHAHLDHIGDAHLFAKSARIIAHEVARNRLLRYRDPRRPIPQISFRRNFTLNFGGKRVELKYPGRGHGAGNILIHLPAEKVLMFVDVGAPRSVPGKGFEAEDLYGQVQGLKKALELDFEIWVAGHMQRPGARGELRQVLQYYYDSRKAGKEALRRVTFESVAATLRSHDPQYRLERYHQAVAQACYAKLLPVWKPRLMGFEAYAKSHCAAWMQFHLTEKAPRP